jgi:phenylpyruvate tautomerase PptA (4-oxalocrotonate tautomerase family)
VPMIDLTLEEGALAEEAKASLARELTAAVIELEGAPDNQYVRAITWCFVDERRPGSVHVGGAPAARPVYRVVLTVPEGAPGIQGPLRAANRERLVARVTELVLSAEGTPMSPVEAGRVWVQIREIRDGFWGAFGEVVRMEDIATYAGAPPAGRATEKGERARAAYEEAQLPTTLRGLP